MKKLDKKVVPKDRTVMFRKNMYITVAQDNALKEVLRKYGKNESLQLREALSLYFKKLKVEL